MASIVIPPPAQPEQQQRLRLLWPVYFADTEFAVDDPRLPIIALLKQFFVERHHLLDYDSIVAKAALSFDFNTLSASIPVADFANTLREEPTTVLACLACAAHVALLDLRVSFQIPARLSVRLHHFAPVTQFKNLKAQCVDKFVGLRGNVVRVGTIQPQVTRLAFECQRCGAKSVRALQDGKYAPPAVCDGGGGGQGGGGGSQCRSTQFQPLRSSAVTVDWQKIKLQEILSSQAADQGRIPRTIECELTGE
jgi:DNA helicase MCM8